MDAIDEAMDLEGKLYGYIRGEVHPVWKRFFFLITFNPQHSFSTLQQALAVSFSSTSSLSLIATSNKVIR
jgi:hypothetical protein